MIDRKGIAISALTSLLIISTITASNTNPALALNFNKNEKITEQNICTNKAICQNRFLQAPGNSIQQSLWESRSSSPILTPSLGRITLSGIAMSDISSIDPSNAGSVIATIPVDRPVPIAFDSSNGDLYVATYCCEQIVSVISGQTNTVIGNPIPVGKSPLSIAFDSSNGDLYVANQENNTVSVISGQTNTVIATIRVGSIPQGIAFDSGNGNLYVSNAGSNSLSVISGQTNTVVGSPIPLPGSPFGIAYDSSNGNIYVANCSVA